MTNKQLKAVSGMNETAERILRMVAERQRNTVYTAFSGLRADLKKRDGKAVDRKEFDDTFKELAKIGAGKLECSKRGVCLGFYWSIPLRQLGTILKNKDEVGQPIETVVPAPQTNVVPLKKEAAEKKVTVVILRRRGEPRTIQIPENRLRELDMQG